MERNVIIFYFFTLTLICAQEANVNSLRFVHALWRHGDRSQAVSYPTEHDVESSWPQGLGELTKIGMRQHYELGQFLRRRYAKFLSPGYNASEIYVRSTDLNRTIMSALSNLAGMFPPGPSEQWNNENLMWQPIPVHTRPRNWDPMLYTNLPCPNSDKEFKDIVARDPEARRVSLEYGSFFSYLKNKMGVPSIGLDNIYFIADPFVTRATHLDTAPWPSWFNSTHNDMLNKLVDIATKFWYSTFNLQRLRGGLLFYDIASRMKQKACGNTTVLDPKLKYYAYSAHDMTQIALMANLGVYNGVLAPYAGVVLVELHERPNRQFHVEMYQRNGTTPSDFHKLVIPGCEPCTVDAFLAMATIKKPSNWWKECGLPEDYDRISPF